MSIDTVQLKHECFPQHLLMGTKRIKSNDATNEDKLTERRIIIINIYVSTK